MAHSLYPGFIKFMYTANNHPHVMTMPVVPSVSGDTWKLAKCLGGFYDPWTAAIDAWNVLFKACLNTADGIVSSDLYTMVSEEADPLYRETYGSVVAGTSASAAQTWYQTVVPHRTSLGGLWRMVILEGTTYGTDIVDRPPIAASAVKNLSDFCIASTGFIFGRDGGRPVAPTGIVTKRNDALRKKYLLNT